MLELLTPIIKAWPSDWCLKANELAIQILGGYGYTREYPVEQFYRDNRLNPIHEGTNGIQAMDLLGRKAMMQNGAAMAVLAERIQETLDGCAGQTATEEHAGSLGRYLQLAASTTTLLGAEMAGGKVRLALANASHYMTLVGHVVMAWMLLEQARLAAAALPSACGDDVPFYEGKLIACDFFFRHELPVVEHSAALLASLDDTTLRAEPGHF